jgi:hypothetical protein
LLYSQKSSPFGSKIFFVVWSLRGDQHVAASALFHRSLRCFASLISAVESGAIRFFSLEIQVGKQVHLAISLRTGTCNDPGRAASGHFALTVIALLSHL